MGGHAPGGPLLSLLDARHPEPSAPAVPSLCPACPCPVPALSAGPRPTAHILQVTHSEAVGGGEVEWLELSLPITELGSSRPGAGEECTKNEVRSLVPSPRDLETVPRPAVALPLLASCCRPHTGHRVPGPWVSAAASCWSWGWRKGSWAVPARPPALPALPGWRG